MGNVWIDFGSRDAGGCSGWAECLMADESAGRGGGSFDCAQDDTKGDMVGAVEGDAGTRVPRRSFSEGWSPYPLCALLAGASGGPENESSDSF